MNKQQKTDLIFITLSSIVAICLTFPVLKFFLIFSPASVSMFTEANFTVGEIFVVLMISSVILGMAGLTLYRDNYRQGNNPAKYEKEKMYMRYIKILGYYNIIIPVILFLIYIYCSFGSIKG
jgi:hypothetical protein